MSGLVGGAGSRSGLIGETEIFYEEGTWTPTQGSAITLSGSFSSGGWYTKIGNFVNLLGWIRGSSSIAFSGGSAGLIGGIPFTISNNTTPRYTFQNAGTNGGMGYAWNTTFYTYTLTPNVSATGSTIYFHLTYKADFPRN